MKGLMSPPGEVLLLGRPRLSPCQRSMADADHSFQAVANSAVFYLYEIYADTGAFRAHLATGHVAHFFTELARRSTTDARALVQLVELHTP